MANSKIQIVVTAKDEASKAFKSMGKSIKKSAKDIGIGMTAIGVGTGLIAKDMIGLASKAEGSYAKFNTVFGENSDDMLKFVKKIRKEMPSATTEIVRMAADLQDLLVPMGLTREKGTEMTKGFVDLANKVAAFNDVDPSQVLEAMKSGLSGSSEPLRAFGINALESALEARALKDGLLEAGQTFSDLNPEVKAQVRAQALLSQAIDNSSDAINGFEENNDSFIRRQQDLNATIKDFKETLGKELLPVVDDLIKKIKPVVENIMEWISQNEELTRKIVLGVAAFGALMLVLGPLLIILPGLITAFGLLATAIGIITSPVGLVILAIIALGLEVKYLVDNFETAKKSFIIIWEAVKNKIIEKIEKLKSSLGILLDEMKTVAEEKFTNIKDGIIGIMNSIVQGVKDAVQRMIQAVKSAPSNIGGFIGGKIQGGLSAIGLAEGGIVTSPTLAMVGEGGEPEAVIPLSKLGGVGGGITVNIGTVSGVTRETANMLAGQIGLEIKRQIRV